MSKILYGIGLAVYFTVSMVALTVKSNRDIAREEIMEIDSVVNNAKKENVVHPENTKELIEQWRDEKLAEKRVWLQKPFYQQIWGPPIHCNSDLYYPLNNKK